MNAGASKEARKTRLASLDDGVVRLGPRTIHIDVTNTCNTDCVTCWDHSPHLTRAQPTDWKRQRADLMFVRGLLADAVSLGGLENVILSGMGEPFTHPDIYEMIDAVKALGLHLTIITNLVLADPVRVMALDVDQLLVGIHGASAQSYLAFHPSFSLHHWETLQKSLTAFAAAGRRYKHVHVICAHNAHELPEMIRQAAHTSAWQANFKLASLRDGTEAVRITEPQRLSLLGERIHEARVEAGRLRVKHNLDVFEAQVRSGGGSTAPIADVGCFLGYEYSRVTVDGTVLYCCNTEVVVGRVTAAGDFARMWRGEAWNALRARLRAGDFFAGCHQCGKLNENVKLSRDFREAFGDARWTAARGGGRSALPPMHLPVLR